uniref:Uncharacterized protein n=1 Tax=Magallana gigas TaxID=29159 RepID=K1Q5A5_MAGGI
MPKFFRSSFVRQVDNLTNLRHKYLDLDTEVISHGGSSRLGLIIVVPDKSRFDPASEPSH